jgi:selenocysteine lyase/cysteine desulfurase
MAFYAIQFNPGDKIITSVAEYASNYIAFLQVAQKTGAIIEVIPDDEHGQISLSVLRQKCDNKVKLISLTHVPTNSGLINPAVEVGKIAKDVGAIYLLDACQSVGQMPIDVTLLNCDILTATGRKFLRAPRGTGFLYVKEDLIERLEPPFLDLHSATWDSPNHYHIRKDAKRFETWETNIATKIGLGAAAHYVQKWGIEAIWHRIQLLAKELRERLSQIPEVKLQDKGQQQCGIITFTVTNKTADQVQQHLQKQGINVSISKAEYARLDMDQRHLHEIVRASVHYYNTHEEIAALCEEIGLLAPS